MIPEELEKLIIRHKSEGHLPFFVNCTTGTTVYGAYDPIEPIADICEKYGIWLHIDVSKSHNWVIFFLEKHSSFSCRCAFTRYLSEQLKVSKSRKQFMVSRILPKNEQTEQSQDSNFQSFFGRIQETINCFRDLLTFRQMEKKYPAF